MRFRSLTGLLVLFAVVFALTGALLAQTYTTGSVAGTITDPAGAVVANATVTLTNLKTGAVQTVKTNNLGYYSFALLQPAPYKVTVASAGFQTASQNVTVGLGSATTTNVKLALSTAQETIEVTGEAAAIQTENANITTNFNARALSELPNSGNDLSAVAYTAPGAVMNTEGGYGNFELYGLPTTSNLFTIDGAMDNDPYFNINNSGATNLMLGLNSIQEASVISNSYSGHYGGIAGANVNYISKSGGNAYHGNLTYWWNGDAFDANTYFLNQQGGARPFVNANQYAGSIGGPIKKDKAWFFFDYEALRLVIPVTPVVNLPTQAFENSVISGLQTSNPSEVPYYNTLFNLFNNTPGGANAKNIIPNGGCGTGPGAYTGLGEGGICALQLQTSVSAHTNDYLAVGRVDINLSNNDRMYLSVHHEHGLQATYTDPISPAFNALSDQPQWAPVQFSETHTFGADKVNNFLASFTWYAAGFQMANQNAAAAAFNGNPLQTLTFGDGSLGVSSTQCLLGYPGINCNGSIMPQGRNITQYQFTDDFSWTRGRHTFKFGASFHRNDVTDSNNSFFVTPWQMPFSIADFAAGGVGPEGDFILQNFPTIIEVPIAMYQLGVYADDELKVKPNLKLTLSLRADHLSNPVCQINCFNGLASNFLTLDHSGDIPVNQAMLGGLHNAFPSTTAIVWQPKVGFAWSPFGSTKTVVRGGVGIFVDALPTGAIDSILEQAPLVPSFQLFNSPLSGPGDLMSATAAANTGFVSNYAAGSLGCNTPNANSSACVPAFSVYNPTAARPPRYYEWDLEVQRDIGWRTTLSAKYVGSHGSFIAFGNNSLNAFGYPGLSATQPDLRFNEVTQLSNIANSNYNGLVVTASHATAGGFQFTAAYTYAHSLDDISNSSVAPFGPGLSILDAANPANVGQFNYGNSDYDIRHLFTMNYVWSDAFRHLTSRGPNALLKGWTFSGTIVDHTGLPFTVVDSSAELTGQSSNFFGPIFANVVAPTNYNCGASGAGIGTPCYNVNNFGSPVAYGNQRRNQFRGPGFFDTDFGGEKAFGIPRWEGASLSIGARVYNLFNHPNFANPVNDIANGNFGSILSNATIPTSIYGAFLGANASPRLIQLQAKLVF
jgi:hypothetical protein